LGETLTAFRHHRDPRDRCANVSLDRGRYRIAESLATLNADFREAGNCPRRVSNLHERRNAASLNLFPACQLPARHLSQRLIDRLQLLRARVINAAAARGNLAGVFRKPLLVLRRPKFPLAPATSSSSVS
jgi:hypothetical protein